MLASLFGGFFFSVGMKDGSGHSDDSEASDHSAMYDDPFGEGTYE